MSERATPNKEVTRPKTQSDFTFNSAKAQCERLLNYLQERGSCSSVEATSKLDIIHPPRRIKDLREKGHHIDMAWVYEPTECGRTHRVGRYYLIKENSGGDHD